LENPHFDLSFLTDSFSTILSAPSGPLNLSAFHHFLYLPVPRDIKVKGEKSYPKEKKCFFFQRIYFLGGGIASRIQGSFHSSASPRICDIFPKKL
jgi:hypothetical protein